MQTGWTINSRPLFHQAFAAKGDTENSLLNTARADTGLTINEIKEVLIQLYAYAGFPRSLNALGAYGRGGTASAARNYG
jgi:alkylhydroperoxidase/carboxymuconolactone decarboxylase family protein YurZ